MLNGKTAQEWKYPGALYHLHYLHWWSEGVSGEVWNSSREEHAVLRGSADMQATIRQKMTADI